VTPRARLWTGILLLVAGLGLVYWRVFGGLLDAWAHDGNYSHGFLIIPIALYLVWERRKRLAAIPPSPSVLGLALFAFGILVLLAGVLGSELFLTRVSLLFALAGMVVFVLGWKHLRALTFPLAFLLLMIPIPAIVFNQIAFPLQLVASRAGAACISAAGIPVLREGNVLILANTSLEVAEACSGIRSLVSLITLGIVFGYFTDPRGWARATIVAATIPIAIVTNAARVAGTGILSHYYGPEAAQGFFHEFSGWVVFLLAFLLVLGVQRLIVRLAPVRIRAAAVPAPIAPPAAEAEAKAR
jgi:exosortase